MDELRRRFLQGLSAWPLTGLIGTGLLTPHAVIAAPWLQKAFTAQSTPEGLQQLNLAGLVESREITLSAPEIAENGAKVDVEVSATLRNAKTLNLFADKNPFPLCASINFLGGALPYSRMQLKLAESTRLRAVISTLDGKHYVAYRDVKVTLGGCGG